MALYGAPNAPSNVAAVTEDGGAIGGTNDGNMPDLSTISVGYDQAEVVALRDAVRELAAKYNELLAALQR